MMTGRILIVDSVGARRTALSRTFLRASYNVDQSASPADAIRRAASSAPDAILLDLAGLGQDGPELCRTLKRGPATRQVPVILLLPSGDAQTLDTVFDCGADDFLVHPLDGVELLARIRAHMRQRALLADQSRCDGTVPFGLAEAPAGFEPMARIGLVAPDAATAEDWRAILEPHGVGTCIPMTSGTVLTGRKPADLYLTCADLASANDGLRLLAELRARPGTRDAATILLLRPNDSERAAIAMDLGAADVLCGGFTPAELVTRIRLQLSRRQVARRVRQAIEDGLELSVRDSLTGLHNRRYATSFLDRSLQGDTQPLAVMMLDLDFFKAVNDRHGHAVGDEVLVEVARRLRARLRGRDLLARMGGEEFLVAMPGGDLEAAAICAERLRLAIGSRPIRVGLSAEPITVTLSIGIAMAEQVDESPERIVARADQALYVAKSRGRNIVTLAEVSAA